MKKLLITGSFIFMTSAANAADNQLALAQLGAKLTSIEEENRRLGGRIEVLEHQVTQLQAALGEAQAQAKQAAAAAAARPPVQTYEPVLGQSAVAADGSSVTKTNEYITKVEPEVEMDNSQAEAEFDEIFNAVTAEDYASAKPALKQFIAKYPNNPLLGEAYFWLGEIAWSERDYNSAAVNYLKGYKEAPTGEKAPENILKMALTLKELKKTAEACKYVERFEKEFPDAHKDLKNKANLAKIEIGCK